MEEDWVDRYIAGFLRAYPQIDSEVEGIVDRICKLNKYLVTTLEDTVAELGLDHAEYKLLVRLRSCAPGARESAGELSRALVMSSGGMTNLLDRLEERGLIRRISDPDDRRSVLVELTAAGKKTVDRAVSTEASREESLFEELAPGERKELNDALRRIMHTFEERLGPPPRGKVREEEAS
ncbi:MAG TPA: MarR family transcriptional regulator [Actinomycetota bacterium]|nr:MarR family transcriptional regulator [Actinomycetota bacterium]